jgi:hypothetical protein
MPVVRTVGEYVVTELEAEKFATDWIASWNAHDIERVMAHYDDDVEYFSMFVAELTGDSTGRIKGKGNVKEYLSKGLAAYPNLNFKLIGYFLGVSSITLQYESVNNLVAAEVFELNCEGLAKRVQCHYASK